MDLIWHIPGAGQDRMIYADLDDGSSAAVGPICDRASSPFAASRFSAAARREEENRPIELTAKTPGHRPGLQATSYILARAASFLRENVKDKGPTLLFSGGSLGLAVQAAWDTRGLGPLAIAVASAAQGEKARALGNGVVLDEVGPSFVDRLKMETRGEGFRTVLVASVQGDAVRRALGAASVFGRVLLLMLPGDPIQADLHSTINYKSLSVEGADIFGERGTMPGDGPAQSARVIAAKAAESVVDWLFSSAEGSSDYFRIE